jgi:type VI secretion system protein VasD
VINRIRFVALAVLAAGCGSNLTQIETRGVTPLNMNEKGENTPLRVRIYFLKNAEAFKNAAYEDLYKKDKEILGGNLVGDPLIIDVMPNETKKVEFQEVKPEVSHIGILGHFRKSNEGKPRHIAVSAVDAKGMVFEFTEYQVVAKPR